MNTYHIEVLNTSTLKSVQISTKLSDKNIVDISKIILHYEKKQEAEREIIKYLNAERLLFKSLSLKYEKIPFNDIIMKINWLRYDTDTVMGENSSDFQYTLVVNAEQRISANYESHILISKSDNIEGFRKVIYQKRECKFGKEPVSSTRVIIKRKGEPLQTLESIETDVIKCDNATGDICEIFEYIDSFTSINEIAYLFTKPLKEELPVIDLLSEEFFNSEKSEEDFSYEPIFIVEEEIKEDNTGDFQELIKSLQKATTGFNKKRFFEFCEKYNFVSGEIEPHKNGHKTDFDLIMNNLVLFTDVKGDKYYIANSYLPREIVKDLLYKYDLGGEALIDGRGFWNDKTFAIVLSDVSMIYARIVKSYLEN